MTYYHGTNAIIGMIDLSRSRLRTDFGKGFYFASKADTAQGWATRRTMISEAYQQFYDTRSIKARLTCTVNDFQKHLQ